MDNFRRTLNLTQSNGSANLVEGAIYYSKDYLDNNAIKWENRSTNWPIMRAIYLPYLIYPLYNSSLAGDRLLSGLKIVDLNGNRISGRTYCDSYSDYKNFISARLEYVLLSTNLPNNEQYMYSVFFILPSTSSDASSGMGYKLCVGLSGLMNLGACLPPKYFGTYIKIDLNNLLWYSSTEWPDDLYMLPLSMPVNTTFFEDLGYPIYYSV